MGSLKVNSNNALKQLYNKITTLWKFCALLNDADLFKSKKTETE